jgi:hypothetical protein
MFSGWLTGYRLPGQVHFEALWLLAAEWVGV